jgi:hypothetical protein
MMCWRALVVAIGCLTFATAHADARGGQRWQMILGDGSGTASGLAQDGNPNFNPLQDDDGFTIYPNKKMCMEDIQDYLRGMEHATPLIDRDQPNGWSEQAHKDLRNAQNAKCVPYVKGKYAHVGDE